MHFFRLVSTVFLLVVCLLMTPVSGAQTRNQLQQLLNALPASGGTVSVTRGLVDLGSTPLLINRNGQTIKCAGADATVFRYRGTGAAIRNADLTVRSNIVIEDCGFDITANGGVAIDWTWWRHCSVNRVTVLLRGSNSRGTYAYGTAKHTPYACMFTAVNVSMRDMYGMTSGNVAHYLDEQITGVGPNANTFIGGRLAGGTVHVLLRAGNANAFRDITSESATTYHVQLGNPYPGGSWWLSGAGNEITGWYVEGAVQFNPCFARMERQRDGSPSIAQSKYAPEYQRLIVSLGTGPFLC